MTFSHEQLSKAFLYRESLGHRWITITKGHYRGALMCSEPEQWVTARLPFIEKHHDFLGEFIMSGSRGWYGELWWQIAYMSLLARCNIKNISHGIVCWFAATHTWGLVCRSRAPSQYSKRRLFVRSRKVSKTRDLYLELSDRSEIWQVLL